GQVIEHIGDVTNPYFEDLLFEVMLSSEGQELRMVVARPQWNVNPQDWKRHDFRITPRRDANDSKPVIGIAPPPALVVAKKQYSRRDEIPPAFGPAADARALTLRTGDVVIAATDPDDPNRMQALPVRKQGDTERTDYDALCKRFLDCAGAPITVEVRHANNTTETTHLGAAGIEFSDTIVGTTVADQGNDYDPYRTAQLPDDVRNPEPGHPDYFEFSRRMQLLAGKPVVLQMRRKGIAPDATPVAVLVPPAFHQVIPGLRMKMGRVKAVRGGSPAEAAGVQAGDRILGVELSHGKETLRVVSEQSNKPAEGVTEIMLDPMRLSFDLRRWVGNRSDVKATIIVARN